MSVAPLPPPPPPTGTERLVVAEAVETDVRVARLGSRALALLVDVGVQIMLVGVLMLILPVMIEVLPNTLIDEAFSASVLRVVTVGVLIVYPTTIETLTNGRSVGKMAMGLRVVREDGGPIRLRHAFTRTLVGVAVEWPGLILPLVTWVVSLLTMLFSARSRRLGDLAAGTIVVHERSPAPWGWVPAMPPSLAGWAAGLDLTAVDDDLALAVRHFLARNRDLREPQRSRLGHELAAELAARVTPPPPHGTPGWMFLVAVVAERRRRNARHLHAGRELTERMWPGFGHLPDPGEKPGAGPS